MIFKIHSLHHILNRENEKIKRVGTIVDTIDKKIKLARNHGLSNRFHEDISVARDSAANLVRVVSSPVSSTTQLS